MSVRACVYMCVSMLALVESLVICALLTFKSSRPSHAARYAVEVGTRARARMAARYAVIDEKLSEN